MDTEATSKTHNPIRIVVIVLALIAIVAVGAAFRLYNVNWD